jgi:phosphohistidine swiveling domain-containing protein
LENQLYEENSYLTYLIYINIFLFMSNTEEARRDSQLNDTPAEHSPYQTEALGNISDSLLSFDQIALPDATQIGGKAANLVLLRKAGLPVPPGFCIPVSAHTHYLEHGRLPESLVQEIIRAKNALGGKIAIRSSATCEDGTDLSMAGVFESSYVYNEKDVDITVERIFTQARSGDVESFMALHGKSAKDVSMGLVVQQLIEPELSGVIYTGVNGNHVLVQYIDGFGARLVDGVTSGSALIIGTDGRIVESTGFDVRPFSKDALNQIQRLALTIEQLFSGKPQDIEFTYRKGLVSIVQARPLTTDLGRVQLRESPIECLEMNVREKIRRLMSQEKLDLVTNTVVFSDANYSEILPKPTEMDIGLHMYTWSGSDGIPGSKQIGHAMMGYKVESEATGVISYIGGRPYSSIGRYAALYHVGFPETKEEYFSTLVAEYLDAVQRDPEKGSYPQIGLFLQDPTLADLRCRYGDRAEEYFKVYKEFTVRMRGFARDFLPEFEGQRIPRTNGFVEAMESADLRCMDCEQLLAHTTTILEDVRTNSFVDFVRGARLGFYYSQRLQGLLREKLGCNHDDAQKLYSKLNQGLNRSAITEANIAIADAASEEEALLLAKKLIGHYSTGEMLEIRHKPMRDDPQALQTYVRGIRQTGNYRARFEAQRAERIQAAESIVARASVEDRSELAEVITASQTYMALRETAKYLFTKQYLLLRDTLEEVEKRLNMESGDIYFLYPRELSALIADPESMRHLIQSRKQSFKNYETIEMPNVITAANVDQISLRSDNDAEFDEATGKFLAEGQVVEGVIVNIDEYKASEDIAELMRQHQAAGIPIVLVATQMNLSHDPFIAQSAGLVIENAGIVAHGAQRARELGKGAIGGIKSRQLKTGMRVFFDPQNQIVRRLD